MSPWRQPAGTTGLKERSTRSNAFRVVVPWPPRPRSSSDLCAIYSTGRKPNVYRVLYEINEPLKAVRVLTIRHGAMDEFLAEGIVQPGTAGSASAI